MRRDCSSAVRLRDWTQSSSIHRELASALWASGKLFLRTAARFLPSFIPSFQEAVGSFAPAFRLERKAMMVEVTKMAPTEANQVVAVVEVETDTIASALKAFKTRARGARIASIAAVALP